jgi:hypothetical protein
MRSFALIITLGLLVVAGVSLHAKCQYGSDWEKGGKKIVVCTKGDSWDDRKKATAVCSKIKGSSCSQPSTFSSSCANNECYDIDGKNHNSLSGY